MTVGRTCLPGEDPVFCQGMNEVMESQGRGTKYQGVKLMTIINIKTGAFARHLVIVKSGKHAKRGLALNFCPFCRSELIEGADKEWSEASSVSRPPSNSEAK